MRIFCLILILVCSWLPVLCIGKEITTEQLLLQLDSVISNRDRYLALKNERLSELHRVLAETDKDDKQRFDALGRLYAEYHSFNSDSAYVISQRQLAIALKTGDDNMMMNAVLNKANILCNVGMYNEALALIDSIDAGKIPDYLRAYYYHANRTLYGNLANFSAFKPEKLKYEKLTDDYRDSLLTVNSPQSLFHVLIKADQLNVHNRPLEAIGMLEAYIDENDLSEHELAICAYTLSDAYGKMRDLENQKRQLIISSIADMRTAVREYVSLRQLALLLYQEGDLERAYRFLTIAVDDAAKSNSRQRIVELNDSYPMINAIYIGKVHDQKKTLEQTILIITILSVILIVLLLYMRRQMLKISDGRRKVEEANDKLNELNTRLSDSNEELNGLNARLTESNDKLNELNTQLVLSNSKLQDAYGAIAEISKLKEVYICQYMVQSLKHIEMLDNYRKTVGKLINSGKNDDLKKLVKSPQAVDDELRAFYDQFDKTFLNLFPTFVEDFNKLLLPEEAMIPKKAGSLNTELRVFALIRLGITDSDKIAKFLRYSITTIYNYRTKVRNKARGDRNMLETEVARIGLN